VRLIMGLVLLFSCCINVLAESENKTITQEYYKNEQDGFEITGPKGWLKTPAEDANVIFKKEANTTLPVLVVTTDSAGDFKTALEYANWVIEEVYKKGFASRQAEMKIIEPAHEIEINGVKGIKFVYEVIGPVNTKNIDCKFMKDKLIVSVMGMDLSKNYDKNIVAIEKAINSFKFLEKNK